MKQLDFSKKNVKKRILKIINYIKQNIFNFVKEVPLSFSLIITSLINTVLLRLITVGNYTYLKPMFFDLGMILILTSFMFLFRNKKQRKKYLFALAIFTTIICVVNSIYYSYYSSFVSVSLLATSAFLGEVGDTLFEKVLRFKDFIYLWQVIFLFFYYFKRNNIKNVPKEKYKPSECRISFVILFVFGLITMDITSDFLTDNEISRFGKMWNRESVLASYGVFTYQYNDIIQSVEPKINNIFGYDKALKKVKDYYEELNETSSYNDYTGIFEGKNVIVIHAESLQTVNLGLSFNGQKVTPTLNKLIQESIYFSNFYSQVGVGTSSDAEFTFSTSLMPSSNGTVFVNYFDRKYNTIQQSFKDKGYYVFSMHANTGDFWNRAVMHKNMGYDKFFSKSSFEIDETIGLGLSDKSFFKQSIPMIKQIAEEKEMPFYVNLITLTNHTPWSDFELIDEFDMSWTIDVNGETIVRDYLNSKTLGDYFRTVHYMDQAIEQFINDLDANGLLDNTVLIIYGDHDARIGRSEYNYMYNYDPYTDSVKTEEDEGYIDYNSYEHKLNKNVPFIIWTKDHKYVKEVTTTTGMIDAYPIIENLFRLETNTYKLGNDVLGKNLSDNTVVFTDGSYVTNKIYYNGQNGKFYPYSGDVIDELYITNNATHANNIIDISNEIINYDLIKEIKEKANDELSY